MSIPRRNDDPPDMAEGRCAICGLDIDSCICPECPECGATGDPACYRDHGLVETEAQRESRGAVKAEIEMDYGDPADRW